jgi:hypothetical protein
MSSEHFAGVDDFCDGACSMKRPFLVVYDYGTGGVWAYVWAESEEQILSRFDVDVISEVPDWLVPHKLVTLDIDRPAPEWAREQAR